MIDRPAHAARQVATSVIPSAIVIGAGLAARMPVATAHPVAAVLLLLWIVSDAMMVALIARSRPRRPSRRAVIAVLATASITVAIGAPLPLRTALLSLPTISACMVTALIAHLAISSRAAWQLWSALPSGKARWIATAGEFLPPAFVRLVAAELAVLHMALLRWGGPPDAPAESRVFGYHHHLAPICATLLGLSVIEVAVYHLLVSHWSRAAAVAMFVLSDIGLVYLIGLIKSFRFRPILIDANGVRVRAGFLIDQAVPFESIDSVETNFAADAIRDRATFNAALLAWPNVLIRLNAPQQRHTIRRRRPFTAVAFRLDDPEPFIRLLRWRLGQPA